MNEMIHPVKRLQEFEVCVKLPKQFAFRGPVPFNMQAKDGIAQVWIYAETETEAQRTAQEYFDDLTT